MVLLLLLMMMMMIMIDVDIVNVCDDATNKDNITVADDNNGAVAIDNGDQLVICLFIL